jgi:type IV pilus assembly protein PilY1
VNSRGRDADSEGDREDRPSVAASRQPADQERYLSPIKFQCQKNFNILLTDGLPTKDSDADDRIEGQTDVASRSFATLTGNAECDGSGTGKCLDDMAAYLAKADLVDLSTNGNPDTKTQSVLTYAIGFGDDVPEGSQFLEDVADRGGTGSTATENDAFNAQDLEGLVETLRKIVTQINEGGSTFVTPSVSVNSFNRNQTLNDLYVSVFAPSQTEHWPGNLKKYRLVNNQIVDDADQPAVGADGFFKAESQSVWSAVADGQNVAAGGAASLIPAPAARIVYTHFSGKKLDLLDGDNANLTDALLGTGSPTPTKADLIDWIHDKNIQSGGQRFAMGDPLHSRPAVVTYGGQPGSPNAYDTVVFMATNDGYLHAITGSTGYDAANKKSVGGGTERWSFIPQELLGRLVNVYRDGPTSAKRTYGLDGEIRVLKFDINQDGIVDADAGDRVILYFGMRRGGRFYYALDVTRRDAPELLWKAGPNELPGVGETWSPPVVTRVKVGDGSSQNKQFLVLLFGGGYDDAEENYTYVTDTSGHRIYMLDAITGAPLWYAGGPDGVATPEPNLLLDASTTNGTMNNAIPGELTVIDTNGDRFADRIYAADLGGRIWRFDITNGASVGNLVAGGVIARLGAGDNASPTMADTRRFYSAPDVALIERRGADPYYNIAIGSGYRGHPTQNSSSPVGATSDRFYSIRDKAPFMSRKQSDYKSLAPILDGDVNLVDVTEQLATATVPVDKVGWKLDLRLNGVGVGEKVLAASTTANNVVLFPTYQPTNGLDPCLPTGVNRVYALRVDNGRPALNFNGDGVIDPKDVSTKLNQSGIVDAVNVGIIRPNDGDPGNPPTDPPKTICIAGVEVLNQCVQVGGTVRTYWKRN